MADDVGKLPTLLEAQGERLFGSELGIGAQVGPYVIEAAGRRGGFAMVYRARHYRDDTSIVAVKVLHEALIHSQRMLLRFEREIELLRCVQHPTIVEVVDYGSLPDGRPYYVMPWVEGTPLDELLAAHGAFSVEEVIAMLSGVIDALRITHARGIIHRDIKPSNLIVSPDGAIRLLDFGIAKIVGDDVTGRHDLTSTGNRIGTPTYMAPEQIAGREVDARTDVYALGVMLFELVTGRLPFTGASALEVESHHLHTPPPRASQYAPVTPAFDIVVMQCMAKQPAERFGGVDAVWNALRAVIAGAATGASSQERPGLGIYVELTLRAADDDAALDALCDALDHVHELCEASGAELALETGRTLLAVMPEQASTAEVVELALQLGELITEEVGVTVTVHRASSTLRDGRVSGGKLLQLDWIADAARLGTWITSAVDATSEDVEVVESDAGLRRLRRAG